MPKFARRVEGIHQSPIRRVAALLDESRERTNIISFGGGAPSVPAPSEFIKEFNHLLTQNAVRSLGYTGTRGIPELREAIARDVSEYGNVDFDPRNEIIVTTGATEAISSALLCLVDQDDEVIVTDPTYLGYKEMIGLAQGKPRTIPVHVEQDYQPDVEQLKESVSKRTKAVMLLSPDNPTGRIISETFVRTLVDLAQEYDFWIISDDIYKHIIYEGAHIWISHYPGARERTVTVCSFSKEAGVPGLRLGYTLAPNPVIESIEKMQQYSTLAPESLGQFALVQFLRQGMKERYIKDSVTIYRKRRDFMNEMIKQHLPFARTTKPAGAYYFFVDLREKLAKANTTDEEFATQLLSKTNVAVIPGRFFGENGTGHVRMSFVSEPEDRIRLGVERMGRFLGQMNYEC